MREMNLSTWLLAELHVTALPTLLYSCVCSGSLHTAIYSNNLLTNYVNSIQITHSVERALLTASFVPYCPLDLI